MDANKKSTAINKKNLRFLSPPANYTDRRLSAKLVLTFADGRCRVVSATDPHCRILSLLGRSRYFFFQVAPQLYSRGWVDPVPGPLHLRKSGSARNRSRSSVTVSRNSDDSTTEAHTKSTVIQIKKAYCLVEV
jgi:hypothetical protein